MQETGESMCGYRLTGISRWIFMQSNLDCSYMRDVVCAAMCGVLAFLLMTGCGNREAEVERLVAERDSLLRSLDRQSVEFDNYEQTVGILNATMDSIAALEHLIFLNAGEAPGYKETLEFNLMRFETILNEQSEKIRQLEERLALSHDSTAQAMRLIAHLKQQIETKNGEIARLRAELGRKNADIGKLRGQVASQSARIDELDRKSDIQMKALAVQDSILNTGYVLIASKKELRQMGLLKGGRLAADAAIDYSAFTPVDLRKWNDVTVQGKRLKVLTAAPSSSYGIVSLGDRNWMLTISSVSDFWRTSRFLIIQTD